MSKQSNNPTLIGFTQQLKPEYWTWASDPQNATALDCDALSLGSYLVQRLEHFGCKVEAAYAIVHDQDMREGWDEVNHCAVMEPKPRHIHGIVKFTDRKSSASLEQLATFLGLELQYVEKPKAGRYALDNMLAYLVHAKYKDKHQYKPEEVATIKGRDYKDIELERRVSWLKGAAEVKTKAAAVEVEYLRERILEGDVSREQVMLTDALFMVYSRHKTLLDEAFVAYGQRRAYQAAAALRNGEFRTTVIYIWGDAGSGKTHFAQEFMSKALAMAKEMGERWHVYRAATANPLDDWQGQEVIFLDDLRGSAMEANDWLLLLDPVNASPARARYANKQEVAPRLIVLTATIPPDQYFFYTRNKGNVDEALDQFIRRLAATVKVKYVDDQRSYFVSPVGRLEEPQLLELGNDKHRQVVEMSFGALGSIEHSAEGAVGALMGYLDAASPDIVLSETDDWETTLQLVESERTLALKTRVAKALAANPPTPALTPEEVAAIEEQRRAQEEGDRLAQQEREEKAAREREEKQRREAEMQEQMSAVVKLRRAQLAKDGRLDEMSKVIAKSLRDSDYVIQSATGRRILPVQIGAFVAILPAEEEVIVKTVENLWTI